MPTQHDGQGLFLGEEFHHNRVNVVCSQIYGVSPELTYRWNQARLVATVMQLQAGGVLDLRPIITQVMFSIPTAIFTEAFLSFVGVGIVLPQCSIGTLIEDGFNNITTLPYQIIPPILALALLMLGFNFIGDGLREALAPKLEDM